MKYDFRLAQDEDYECIIAMFKRTTDNMNLHGIYQWDEYYPTKEILRTDILGQEMVVLTSDKKII